MALEVKVSFDRHAVFYAGERLSCRIKVKNLPFHHLDKGSHHHKHRRTASGPGQRASFGVAIPPLNVIRRNNHDSDSEDLKNSVVAISQGNSPNFGPLNGPLDAVLLEEDWVPLEEHAIGTPVASRVAQDTAPSRPKSDIKLRLYPRRTCSNFSLRSATTAAAGSAESQKTLLWAFAQVVGSFAIDSRYIKPHVLNDLHRIPVYAPLGAPRSGASSHRLPFFGISGIGGGGHVGKHDHSQATRRTKPEGTTYPVLSTPPALLFSDLDLASGQSRTYVYSLRLPLMIPPSHPAGRSFKFHYKLIVNIQQDKSSDPVVVELPFRVLSAVEDDAEHAVYDVLKPVTLSLDEAQSACIEDRIIERARRVKKTLAPDKLLEYLDGLDLEQTIQDGLSGLAKASSKNRSDCQMDDPEFQEDWEEVQTYRRKPWERIMFLVNRQTRPVVFNITKESKTVGRCHLPRTSFRLGDSIQILLDFSHSVVPCLQVSVFLESEEIIQPGFCTSTTGTFGLSKTHSESHRTASSMLRVPVDLVIPTDATAGFRTTAVEMRWSLRFEFIVSLLHSAETPTIKTFLTRDDADSPRKPFTAPSSPEARDIPSERRNLMAYTFERFQACQEIAAESLGCVLPILVYGGNPQTTAVTKSRTRVVVEK